MSRAGGNKAKGEPAPLLAKRTSRVSWWGNSLGVRIPQQAVDVLGLADGGTVVVEVTRDAITIRPLEPVGRRPRKRRTLESLLKNVKAAGGEFWGESVGSERL